MGYPRSWLHFFPGIQGPGHPSKLPPKNLSAAAGWFPGSLLRPDRLSGPAGGPGQLWVFLVGPDLLGSTHPLKGCGSTPRTIFFDSSNGTVWDFMIRIYGDLCGDMTI